MQITPRPYQTEAIQAIKKAHSRGITRQLVSLPTGSGKTIVFSMLAKTLHKKTLILAHREELLEQAWQKMRLVHPEATLGLVRGARNEYRADIVISSVQTASQPKRLNALRRAGFDVMIIDEAHHATAPSYQKVIAGLGFFQIDPEKLLVGFTATAFRGDGFALGDVFQEVAFERTIMSMIRAGYLCDATGKSISTDVDLSNVRTRGGDFAVNELAFQINVPERNQLVVDSYLEHCQGRKAVVFAADVQHATDLAATFIKAGVMAAPVWGAMGPEARKHTLQQFHDGRLQVLTNCAVLTEGFDDPAISAVLLARPTKSRVLYTQMVGRGLRLYPGKSECLVLDFGDNVGRHNLCGLATLAGDPKLQIREGESLREAVEKKEQEPQEEGHVELGDVTTQTIELFERSRFVWTQAAEHFCLALGGGRKVWLKSAGPDTYEVAVYSGNKFIEKLSDMYLPLGYAQGVAEDYVRIQGNRPIAAKSAQWRNNPASEKQKSMMRKLRIPFDEEIRAGEASQLIDQKLARKQVSQFEPATAKQKKFLRWKGIAIPENLSKGEASMMIMKIKKKKRKVA